MYLSKHILAIVTVTLLSAVVFAKGNYNDWRLGADKDGIKVYTRKSEQGKIRTARAEMFLNVPPNNVITALLDFTSYAKWFPNCKSAQILKRYSEREFVSILVYKTPWPLPDMDCVERMTIERRTGNDTTFIHVKAEPDFIETTSAVRVKQMEGTWLIIAQNGGTQVVNTYYSDMGGIIPYWLANTQTVEIPFNIFTHMRNYVISTLKLDNTDRPVVKKTGK
jgi:hypothetical protein